MMKAVEDVAIIGGGPAGLTAALYAARAGKKVVVFNDPETSLGGQITSAPCIENYPALKSVSGVEFANNLIEQVAEFGVRVVELRATYLSQLPDQKFEITCSDESIYLARAVVLATGNQHRHLNIPGEKNLIGSGISFCALCDGSFYEGEEVAVVGGGNSALQEAIYLSTICKKVTMIVRRDVFRGDADLAKRIEKIPNITVMFNQAPIKFEEGPACNVIVTMEDQTTGELSELPVECVFEACGFIPQITPDLFDGFVSYTKDGAAKPTQPGVFVAGDVIDKEVRQLATAIGDGAIAGSMAAAFASAQSEKEVAPV